MLPAGVALAHLAPALGGAWPVRRRLFPGWAGTGARDHVALAFAGGLDPESTPPLLDALDAASVGATFFVLGERLARFPALARALVDRGHEVAVEGWRREAPWLPRPRATADGLRDAVTAVIEICGVRPVWYRPHGGVPTTTRLLAARRAALRPVLCGPPARDLPARADAASVGARIRTALAGGAAVLLHDAPAARAAVLGALPVLLDDCRVRGLDVGPLREHGLWWH